MTRTKPTFFTSYRIFVFVSLLILTPLGFATKFYSGPFAGWVNDSLGGVFYEIFWILVVTFAWPRFVPLKAAIGVFMVTDALEFLQLWHPAFLQKIRATFLGSALIGTTFVRDDFLYYFLGCVLGWWYVRYLRRRTKVE